MRSSAPALRVVSGGASGTVMFDPGNFTPFYIDSLCRGLAALGARPGVISSPPLFETVDPAGQYRIDQLFFPMLNGRVKTLLRRRTRLRQAIRALGYPAGLWRTWRQLRSSPPGVFHIHWALVPPLDALLARALRSRGWRIVFTVHDPLPAATRRLPHRLQARFLESVDAMIVHTARLERELVAAYPQASGRVHVVPHGGAPEPPTSDAERARARRVLEIPAERSVLLFFGMIKPYKGLEYLLAAMPRIIATVPGALLVIAGEPLMPMGPYEQQIERLGLRDSLLLRLSFIPQSDVGLYYTAADLVVAPYVAIAASGVIAQAQGHGRPVVVTRVGGLPEFVEPDDCGFVVPPRSPEALAEAIGQALRDPKRLAEMGERARRRIAREHDWSSVARQTLDVYHARLQSSSVRRQV